MSMSQIRLYDLFRKELNLPDNKAADFVLAVAEVTAGEDNINMQPSATKNDINSLEIKMERSINSLELKIEQSKSDIYKAMFWMGIIVQIMVILGGMMALLKFMR
jgi:hypothetical protein